LEFYFVELGFTFGEGIDSDIDFLLKHQQHVSVSFSTKNKTG